MVQNTNNLHQNWVRISVFLLGILTLVSVYVFQQTNWLGLVVGALKLNWVSIHPFLTFVVNKTTRLILNDLACFGIIYAIFQQPKYLRMALWVFLFELACILPLYFIVKLSIEGVSEISSPLLSQVHRLIVNPTLMILLMVGFFYQRSKDQV